MKEIDHRDVETYVRTLISESFGLQTKGPADKAGQRDEDAHTANSSVPVQPKTNQKEKRNDVGSKSACQRGAKVSG